VQIRSLLNALLRNKSGPLLVSVQVAITLAVLVNVLYVVGQDLAQLREPTGLDLDDMFWISTAPTGGDQNYNSAIQSDLLYLNSLPEVVGATTVNNVPQSGASTTLAFAANAEELQTPKGGTLGLVYFGTDKFLDALGLKLIAGHNFDLDAIKPPATGPVAAFTGWASEVIVTQAMANELYPDGNALGKTVYAGLINKSATIVGIVDFMQANLVPPHDRHRVERVVIAPIIVPGPYSTYIIRARPGQRTALMAKLQKSFAETLQPGRFLSWIENCNQTASNAREETRANVVILAVVAVCVLVVTIVGISGLGAFNVAKRTKQLGIRRAIGASRLRVVCLVLVENWIITSFGTFLGCLLALVAGMKLSSLYGIPRFPLYYLPAAVMLLWIVGLLAVSVPARRAASIAPAVATRSV
jgi:putative ABC transport system permease protein